MTKRFPTYLPDGTRVYATRLDGTVRAGDMVHDPSGVPLPGTTIEGDPIAPTGTWVPDPRALVPDEMDPFSTMPLNNRGDE
jgi:hypothetical protein